MPRMRRSAGGPSIVPWAALLLASSALLALLGPLAERPALCLALALAAGAAWWRALALAGRSTICMRAVLVVALLLRALALGSDLRSSDDAHRILWEGEVVLAGASPYAFAPQAPELAPLRARQPELFAGVNHRDVPAAYPPLTQAVGVAAAAAVRGLGLDPLVGGVQLLRATFALADLLVLLPLIALLRRAGRPPQLALAWGWCPLAAFEFGGAGHFDSLGMALLLGALALLPRAQAAGPPTGRAGGLSAGLVLGLAAAVKFLPLVALPWMARAAGRLAPVVVALAVLALAYAPLAWLTGGARGLFEGLGEYSLRWESGSLVHRWIEAGAAWFGERDLSWSDPRRTARALALALWLAWAWRTWRREHDPALAAGSLIGAFLLLSPTLHPWYISWIVPFLALRPWRGWCWLVCAAPLLYVPLPLWQREGVWNEPVWLWPLIALPLFALALSDRRRWREPLPASRL